MATVTDSANTPETVVAQSQLAVNPIPSSSSWVASNPKMDQGQLQTLTVNVAGGSSPFTYNFLVYNSMGDLVYTSNYPGTWKQTTSYPIQKGSGNEAGCAEASGNIYCIDGDINGGIGTTNAVNSAPLSSNGIGAWSSTTNYPIPVEALSCLSYSNTIYCIGGDSYTPAADYNSVYYAKVLSNGNLGAWQSTTPYPLKEDSAGCLLDSNTIYCVAGMYAQTNPPIFYNSVYYAPILISGGLGAWQSATPYPLSEEDASCNLYSNTIYCIGGLPGKGPMNSWMLTSNTYYVPIKSDGSLGSWTQTTSYPTIIGIFDCLIGYGVISCPGGIFNGYSASLPSMRASYSAPLSSNGIGAWSSTTPYPVNAIPDCIAYNNYTYCAGGFGALGTPGDMLTQSFYIPLTPQGFSFSGANAITTFQANSIWGTGTFTANIMITDSAGEQVSNTLTFKVSPVGTIEISLSTNTINLGQGATVSATISGGTGPFTANLIYVSGPLGATVNSITAGNVVQSLTGQVSGAIPFLSLNSFSEAGTYTFNVVATDTGASSQITFNSTQFNISVINAPPGGGNPSYSVISLSDNINSSSVLGTPVFKVFVINPLTGQFINTYDYYQNQLPTSVQRPSSDVLNISFACTVSIGSAEYAYAGTIYGIGTGSSAQCDKNYTIYGGAYKAFYSSSSLQSQSTTTTATTTIPQKIIKQGCAAILNISSKSSGIFNCTALGAEFNIITNSTKGISALLISSNATSSSPAAPANFTKIIAINESINSTNTSVKLTLRLRYSCSIPSNRIAPYILEKGVWAAITPFNVNSGACTISFIVPNDPIVALFQASPTVTIPIPATTSSTTTVSLPSVTPPPPPPFSVYVVITIMIVIIIIAMVALLRRKDRHNHRNSP
jgi:hypothetical protein